MKTNYKVAIALVAGTSIGGAAIQGLHAQAKPFIYLVTEVDVTNPEAYGILARSTVRPRTNMSGVGGESDMPTALLKRRD